MPGALKKAAVVHHHRDKEDDKAEGKDDRDVGEKAAVVHPRRK